MKAIPYTLLIGLFMPMAVHAAAPVIRDAATSEQLTLDYRKAVQANPMKAVKPTAGPDLTKSVPQHDILKDSDVLCFNGNATLVPKRAVLVLPKSVEGRLKYVNGAKLMSWSEFYALNRGWITTVEVSQKQAEGNDPIAEKTQDLMQKSGNLVVATYQGGPISVLPPAAPKEPSTPSEKP